MKRLSMCRICLVEDVRMQLIVDSHLQEIFESLTLMPFETEDNRPVLACYICCAKLKNCYQLRKLCLRSEELFTQMLNSNVLVPAAVGDISPTHRLRVTAVMNLSFGHVEQKHIDCEVKVEDPGVTDDVMVEDAKALIMPNKIIHAVENSKAFLTTVPGECQKDGILKYPKKNIEKYRRKEESAPNEKWPPINSASKRTNLTFREVEVERMCKTSDTETDKEVIVTKKRRQNKENFNKLAEECRNTQDPISENENVILSQEYEIFFATDSTSEIPLNTTRPEKNPETEPNSIQIIHSKLDELAQSVKMLSQSVIIVQKNQQELYDIQQQVLLSLANVTTQFEEIVKTAVPSQPNINQRDNIAFKPISNLENFDAFEEMLQNSDYTKELLESMSIVCGAGRGKGINNAYALVDVIFTRDFLHECSWAGGSRGETSNICFKSRNNIIQFFFKVINRADNRFTLLDTQQFFKVILRNSKQRSRSQVQRKSVTKIRVKRPQSKELVSECAGTAEQSAPAEPTTRSIQKQQLPATIVAEKSTSVVPTRSIQKQELVHTIVAKQ